MADTIVYGLAEEVLKNLGSRALNEIASTWGFKDELQKLKRTVNTIKNVLLDAEERQARADGHAIRGWLQELATVVYAADDLFDEFNTIASRKKLLGGNKVTKEVRTFFSTSNQIAFAFKLSRKIKSVREKLEAIRKDGVEFGLAQRALQQVSVISGGRDQTCSYVDAEEVVGRDADKKAILDLLLSENEHEHEPAVLPIVGIGGMGKTTLAQLIYSDSQVQNYFELRLWVCVAEEFDIKVIVEKILRSATNTETPKLDMEQLHTLLRNKVAGKKYLLVLDDVWEENPNKWKSLRALLKIGRKDSKILVTTRSRKVAIIMETFPSHELKGLSEEKSWALFKNTAFTSGDTQQKPHLEKLGKEMVKKCANVPLAIKTLGGLLRCEDESKWPSFKDKNLIEVINVLKLSYQHLLSPLKNCFAFCALFPKDYGFKKEKLIELWMSEGFIIPDVNGGMSLEDVAEDYFLNLLQRGFFQDVRRNEWGNIMYCKIHDLFHDLAQEEAKAKCKVTNFRQIDFTDTILHLSFPASLPLTLEISKEMLKLKLLRTFLCTGYYPNSTFINKSTCPQVLKFHHLRVLDLQVFKVSSLPSSIGKLIHLRYLNLSFSTIQTLPNSITNLYNLQTLNLKSCYNLETLPVNIQKLVNLRSLDVSLCNRLTHMPSGIGRLTSLHKLPMFIVGHKQSVELKKIPSSKAKLSDLKKLSNLRGALSICVCGGVENNMSEAMEADIHKKHGLTELEVLFHSYSWSEDIEKKHAEAVLEGLKPHCNLRKLSIKYYTGEKLPSWAVMHNLGKNLSNLVDIELCFFKNCKELPYFSQLRSLKCLKISNVDFVEYMEREVEYAVFASTSSNLEGIQNIFFPSLIQLGLTRMRNLKGWWKEEIEEASTSNDDAKGKEGSSSYSYQVAGASGRHHLLSLQFRKLSILSIIECPNLIFLPLCPNLEDLTLLETNKKLSLLNMDPTNIPSSSRWSSKFKRLKTDDVEDLISLSQLGISSLSSIQLNDKKMESTERLGDVFATLSSSLQSLNICHCYSLRSISKGLKHLTALENLHFSDCRELELSSTMEEAAEEDANLMPWNAFKTSLRSLGLELLPKLVSLPSGNQHLTNLGSLNLVDLKELREVPEWIGCLSSLQYLQLDGCHKLKFLPQGFQKLTSLNQLYVDDCPGLTERCRSPNGTDWPNICHIPRVRVDGVLQNVEAGSSTR